MDKLIIEAGNNGDMSVGVAPLDVKITIEVNGDIDELVEDLRLSPTKQTFEKDVQNLLLWIDDSVCKVYSVRGEK